MTVNWYSMKINDFLEIIFDISTYGGFEEIQ